MTNENNGLSEKLLALTGQIDTHARHFNDLELNKKDQKTKIQYMSDQIDTLNQTCKNQKEQMQLLEFKCNEYLQQIQSVEQSKKQAFSKLNEALEKII